MPHLTPKPSAAVGDTLMHILKFKLFYTFGLLLVAGALQADTLTFAQFTETATGGNFATFTNAAGAASLTITEPVIFQYIGLQSFDTALLSPQAATLTLTATSTDPALTVLNAYDLQSSFYGSFSFRGATNVNLLTGSFGVSDGLGGAFFGSQDGNTGSFTSTGPLAVSFSSAYLNFTNPVAENFSFSFSSLEPAVNFANGKISPFTAAATGTFASDAAPTSSAPEPPALASIGIGLAGLAVFTCKRALPKL